eukprot:GHVH01012140.1.p1 GENE.GHVH01012140.1~~GHVH01012140.1.p1  ORF type:complete len:754 (+),score=103.78 GHVH01012140.1:84-2345(+)
MCPNLPHPLRDARGVWKCKTVEEMTECLTQMKKAQTDYSTFNQEQVDKICAHVSRYLEKHFKRLADMAAEETKVGNAADKLIKNIYAGCVVNQSYKDTKTCDLIEYDTKNGVRKFASPMGIVAGFVPFTNPTATTLYKSFLVLKSRNGIIFSPTPNCQESCYETVAVLSEAFQDAGGPEGLFGVIYKPKGFVGEKLTEPLMKHPLIDIIFATGGKGMVTHAYSSGKPSLGVGSGNVPVIVEEEADISETLSQVARSKTFDYGVLCSSEEVLLVQKSIYRTFKEALINHHMYHLLDEPSDVQRVRETLRNEKGVNNMKVIGKSAATLANEAGIIIPMGAQILVAECKDSFDARDSWLREKMCPALAMICVDDLDDAFRQANQILSYNGMGHSAIIHTNQWLNEKQHILTRAGITLPVGRITVNQPGCFGTIGGLLNFGVGATMSIGCGSWGGNSTSDNIGPQHLVNFKTVAVASEDVRLSRKAVNLFKPEAALIRGAVEMFCVSLEYISFHQSAPTPNEEMYKTSIECCRTAFTFLQTISNDISAINSVQAQLCDALTEYHGCRLHKVKGLQCSDVRVLSRTINVSPGYLLFIIFPYILKFGVGDWTQVESIIGIEIGRDGHEVAHSLVKVGLPLHLRQDALPDLTEKKFGLDENRLAKLLKYKAPDCVHFCTKDMRKPEAIHAALHSESIGVFQNSRSVHTIVGQKSIDMAMDSFLNKSYSSESGAPEYNTLLIDQHAVLQTHVSTDILGSMN